MEPKEFQVKLDLVRIFLRLIYCQRMATSQKSSNVWSSFSVEGKPWGRAQGHPALSSPVGLWVQWSKFFPGPRLDLERCLSNFLSMDLEASESLKLWAFYTSILASSWAHEPLSLIAHASCMVTHDLASESRVNQLHLLMGKSGIKEVEESHLCLSVTP